MNLFLDSLSFFSFTLVLLVMSCFSRRLGDVMKMKPYYYIYYLSILFTLVASMVIWISPLLYLLEEEVHVLSYVLFSMGMTLGVLVTVKYWSWIPRELWRGR